MVNRLKRLMSKDRSNKVIAVMLTAFMMAGALGMMSFDSAGASPLEGSMLVERSGSELVLTIKSPTPIEVPAGTSVTLMVEGVSTPDFSSATIQTTVPLVTTGGFMTNCGMSATTAFTIPADGITVRILNANLGETMDGQIAKARLMMSAFDFDISETLLDINEEISFRRLGQSDIKDSTLTANGASINVPSTFELKIIPDTQFVTPLPYVPQEEWETPLPGTSVLITAVGADFGDATLPTGYTIIHGGKGTLEFTFNESRTITTSGLTIAIGNVTPYLISVSSIYIELVVPWGFTPYATPADIPVNFDNFPVNDSTLTIPADTAMYTKTDMTLILRGAGQFELKAGDYLLLDTKGGADHSDATVTTPGVTMTQFDANRIKLTFTNAVSVPLTGLTVIIQNVEITKQTITPAIELYSEVTGAATLTEITADQVKLVVHSNSSSFDPDYNGVIPSTDVSVTAVNKRTNATATVNGRVSLSTENGHITLLNSQQTIYTTMMGGIATFTVTNLADSAGLHETYDVDLVAKMDGKDIDAGTDTISVTPHPRTVTGTVKYQDGTPVAGAIVNLSTPDGFMASRVQTDANGVYTLYGTPVANEYRVTAEKDDMSGGDTVTLGATPLTKDITLYSQVKVTVNFYKNKATLDGTPNSNIISPGNLYPSSAYRIEAYTSAACTTPIIPLKVEGRNIYFKMADITGKLFIRAVPLSKDVDPFIDSTSDAVEVDHAVAADPYNMKLDLIEKPVGTITVRNADASKSIIVSFEKHDGSIKYLQTVIQPGGMYTLAPPEGKNATVGTVQMMIGVAFGSLYDRYLAQVGLGRKAELTLSTADFPLHGGNLYKLSVDKQIGDLVSLSLQIPLRFHLDQQFSMELSSDLELPSNWKNYVTLTIKYGNGGCEILPAMYVNAAYNSEKHAISFSYDKPWTPWANGEWYPNNATTDYYLAFYDYLESNGGIMSTVYTFAVKPKDNDADTLSHHIVATSTRILRGETRYNPDIQGRLWFESVRAPLTSAAFVTGYPLSLEGASATNSGKVFVQGYAKPGASVVVNVEGYPSKAMTATANQMGRYSATVTLPDDSDIGKTYTLVATSSGKASNTLAVRVSKSLVYAEELWMDSSQTGQFNKSYLLIDNDLVGGVIKDQKQGTVQNIMIGDKITFRVKMNQDNAVQKVFVKAYAAGGSAAFNIPCTFNSSTGYWESEKLQSTMPSNLTSFEVVFVKNFGNEVNTLDDMELARQNGQEGLEAWNPPDEMFSDPEAFYQEAQTAYFLSLPPEMRGASYKVNADGSVDMTITMPDGQSFTLKNMKEEELTGAAKDAFITKAKASGQYLPLGSGGYYSETEYVITKNGGATVTYTEQEFANLGNKYNTFNELKSALDASNISVSTTEYLSLQPKKGLSFNGVEITNKKKFDYQIDAIGIVAAFGGLEAPKAMGNYGMVMDTVGIADNISFYWDWDGLYMSAQALYDNLMDFDNSECMQRLRAQDPFAYTGIQTTLYGTGSVTGELFDLIQNKIQPWRQRALGWSLMNSTLNVGSMAFGAVSGQAGATAMINNAGIQGSMALAKSSVGAMGEYSVGKEFSDLFTIYKNELNRLTQLSQIAIAEREIACGMKESTKTEAAWQMIYDPQGIVYDGTLDHPVAGIRAELWTVTDTNGDGTIDVAEAANATFWSESADYDQINPQITDTDGMFSWFTPEGWWQVRVFEWNAGTEVKGDELGNSEWLKVLPPHFGVNINIGKDPVTVKYDPNGGNIPLPEPSEDPDDLVFDIDSLPQTSFLLRSGSDHSIVTNMFIRDGHGFIGWNTQADGNGSAYALGMDITNIQSDVTLYAIWEEIHEHVYGGWVKDASGHWHECACGDKKDNATHVSGDWIVDTAATAETAGSRHKECTVCGYVTVAEEIPATGTGSTEDTPDDGLPIALIAVVVVAALAGVGACLYLMSRKK